MDPKPKTIIILSDDEDDTGSTLSLAKKSQAHSSPAPIKKAVYTTRKTDMPSSNQGVEQGAGPASEMAVFKEAQKLVTQDTPSASTTITAAQAGCNQKSAAAAAIEADESRSKSFSGPSSNTEATEISPRSLSEPCPKKATKLRLTQPRPPKMPGESTSVQTYLRAPNLTEPPQESSEGLAYLQAPKLTGPTQDSTQGAAYVRAPVAYMGPHKNAATVKAIRTSTTPAAPAVSSSTIPNSSNGSSKSSDEAQPKQQRIVGRTTQPNSSHKHPAPANVAPGKRKSLADPVTTTKHRKVTNPTPVAKSNSILWSVPAYEPSKDTATAEEEKKQPAISTLQPFLPQSSTFTNSANTDPSSAPASDSKDNATKPPSAAGTPPKAAKKPRSAPWTSAQLSDLGKTIISSVPWDEFASRCNKPVSECLQLYSVTVGMPLMDFQDATMTRAKMAKFKERRKNYSDMEKEARKIHREEARQEKKAEKERAKAESSKQKARAAAE